ncbi:unannotated protein [freshwater metagenome]|uniref:Unannotated protein n=1 Tax=freshwater metagenome TaxID=449393 RepID=A0A6J6FKD0_9ZZZZ|nr:hypothetical protein [Actinomycetota bacterium]
MAVRKPQPLTGLAEKIRAFTSQYKVENDPYLNGLLEAIDSKKNLHVWAELDPLDYLPHPEGKSGFAKARMVRVLTVIRNVLVFAPVALTWAAVSAATTGFSKYIAENGADVVNFLDFWQNGYEILAEEWRIGNVARLDFLIVMIVIALTLYVSQAGHTVDALREGEEDEIDRQRMALALEIHAQLHDKKKITAVNMNASLAGAISRLVSATHNLEDASKVMEKASRKLPKAQTSTSGSFLDSFTFSDSFDEPKPRKSRRA